MKGLYAVAVAAILVVFSTDTVWGHQQLDLPVCPSEDNGEVILFPKPENCSEFYQCADGYLFTHHCPENLYYCPEKEYCAWFFEPNCTFNCQMVKKKHAVDEDTPVPAAAPECPPQIDGNLTLISNPDNCSSYYECDNGVPVEMGCPGSLYFCTEKSTCTWIWDPNCTFNCQILNIEPASVDVRAVETAAPECPPQIDGNLTLISNPDNCSSYYECDNGVPVEMGCPGSLYFCTEKSTCTWIWDPNCTFNCQILNIEPASVDVRAVETAAPVCPPQIDGNLTLISNPDNCSSYYECDNGVPVEMGCPGSLYFCTEKSTCTWIWDPNCTFNCQILNIEPASVDVRAVETAAPVCPPQIDGNLTLLSNPDNCSSYYECDNGVPVEMGCPGSLYFCTEKSTCTWVWEPDCTFNCKVLNRETVFVEDYDNDGTVPLKNHKIEVPEKRDVNQFRKLLLKN